MAPPPTADIMIQTSQILKFRFTFPLISDLVPVSKLSNFPYFSMVLLSIRLPVGLSVKISTRVGSYASMLLLEHLFISCPTIDKFNLAYELVDKVWGTPCKKIPSPFYTTGRLMPDVRDLEQHDLE